VARSDNIRADIERVRTMPAREFADRWGEWARVQDREIERVRQRWIDDLEKMLPFAEQEEALLGDLVAAKEAYRTNPSRPNRAARAAAVTAVQALRATERADRARVRIAGDAYVSGV